MTMPVKEILTTVVHEKDTKRMSRYSEESGNLFGINGTIYLDTSVLRDSFGIVPQKLVIKVIYPQG